MTTQLRVWVPHLPPSSNQIYIRHPTGKGRILSDKARAFKIKAMRTIQQEGHVAFLHFQHNVTYELTLAVFFEQVEVKTSTKGSRFKKIDLSNQVKLIEDTVAEAIGIDDSHNFRLKLEKHCDPKNPGLYVIYREIPEEEVNLTKEAYDGLQHGKPVRAGGPVSKGGVLRRSYRDRTRGVGGTAGGEKAPR